MHCPYAHLKTPNARALPTSQSTCRSHASHSMPGGRHLRLKQMEVPVHSSSSSQSSPSALSSGWLSAGSMLNLPPQKHITLTNLALSHVRPSAASASMHSSWPGRQACSNPVRRSSRQRASQPDSTSAALSLSYDTWCSARQHWSSEASSQSG